MERISLVPDLPERPERKKQKTLPMAHAIRSSAFLKVMISS
jgi:hypothetical protein